MWPFRTRSVDDFRSEIESHIALEIDRLVGEGVDPADARAAARRKFGNTTASEELFYVSRRVMGFEDLRKDVVYAARSLRRHPGFACVAILTLALGIGATTAIFSVVNALLLKPLAYKESDRLVRLTETVSAADTLDNRLRRSGSISVAELLELRSRTKTLSHVAFSGGPAIMTLSGRGEATRLQGMRVAPGIFETLGVQPILGRGFGAAEEVPGGDAVIVLSYATWHRYFGGDSEILGQTLTLANSLAPNPQGASKGYVVVGVMPQGFEFADGQIQFWIPVAWAASTRGSMMARLADGISISPAATEVGTMLREIRKARSAVTYELVPALDGVVEPVKSALLVLMVAAGFVLLIACVNVANLLFARTAARQREIAIRVALGAGRGRVIRQLLTESVMLAVLGGMGGTVLAIGGVRLLRTLATTLARMDLGVQLPFPRLDEIGMDASVMAYVMGISLLTGVLFGLAPAVRHSHPAQTDALRESASTAYSGFGLLRRGRARGLLVVGEIAMAMILLIGGGLLIHSFVKLTSVEGGYNPRNVLTFQVALPAERYPIARLKGFAEDLVARLGSVPEIQAAAYGQLPMVAITETAWFRRTPDLPKQPPPGGPEIRLISRDYLEVMGIRVISGRGFTTSDHAGPRTLLINQRLARSEFPREDPIGQHVFAGSDSVPWEIVGVVADVRQSSLDREPEPQVFAEHNQWPGTSVFPLGPYFSVRTRSSPMAVVSNVREIARQLDAEAGLFNVATMEQIVSNRISRPRMYAVLLGVFAGVAVALAVIGIYGVMAYSVAQRTREIGIRMALGARRSEVMGLVLGQSVVLTAVGMIAGVAGAALVTRYLQGMLFGLTPLDLATFVAVSVFFVAVATLASYVPARRATKVDPLVALRYE